VIDVRVNDAHVHVNDAHVTCIGNRRHVNDGHVNDAHVTEISVSISVTEISVTEIIVGQRFDQLTAGVNDQSALTPALAMPALASSCPAQARLHSRRSPGGAVDGGNCTWPARRR
jgi:hypothetical protein